MIFLARLCESKNLLEAIETLRGVDGEIVFDVYGPVEKMGYLGRCLRALAELPPNVTIDFHGPIDPAAVHETLARYHVFLLPTRSENFGFAIVEAMHAGCPPVITDQTPWRGLAAARAGWDLPLGDTAAFRAALRQAVAMDDAEWRRWVEGAQAFARRAVRPDETREAFFSVLRHAAARAA